MNFIKYIVSGSKKQIIRVGPTLENMFEMVATFLMVACDLTKIISMSNIKILPFTSSNIAPI